MTDVKVFILGKAIICDFLEIILIITDLRGIWKPDELSVLTSKRSGNIA